MEKGINASRFGSVAIRILFGFLTPPMAVACLWGGWDTLCQGQLLAAAIIFALLLIWLFLMDVALRDGPRVYLTEEGVWVRVMFRRQFYPWSEIVQVGIIHRPTYKGDRNWPFLLLPGGSPMGENDKTFVYRNYGRIVWIHRSAEVLEFVTAHYGLLDFDKSVDPRGTVLL